MKKLLDCKRIIEGNDKYEELVPEMRSLHRRERVHIVSCAKIGYMMAEKRGVDPILAAAACACHDYGRIIIGKQAGHAEAGYIPVQEFLKKTGLFSDEEIAQIAVAVRNHSKKEEIGSPLEEIVKDADVLDFYQYGYDVARRSQQDRLENCWEERCPAIKFSDK